MILLKLYCIFTNRDEIEICKMLVQPIHTTRNKHEKLEGKGEASFDNPFMMQSHAESMKKIVEAL